MDATSVPRRVSLVKPPAAQVMLAIGREAELAELGSFLRRPDVRLLTLLGPGGTGKTRLAIQAAHELKDRFADGG